MSGNPKRARTSNYSVEDQLELINLAKENKKILENKRTDAVTSGEKNKIWAIITKQFNAQTTMPGNEEHLRQKCDSLKGEARRYAAKKRQARLRTGAEIKFNVVSENVLELIKLSSEGNTGQFDCDAIFLGISPLDLLFYNITAEVNNSLIQIIDIFFTESGAAEENRENEVDEPIVRQIETTTTNDEEILCVTNIALLC